MEILKEDLEGLTNHIHIMVNNTLDGYYIIEKNKLNRLIDLIKKSSLDENYPLQMETILEMLKGFISK